MTIERYRDPMLAEKPRENWVRSAKTAIGKYGLPNWAGNIFLYIPITLNFSTACLPSLLWSYAAACRRIVSKARIANFRRDSARRS